MRGQEPTLPSVYPVLNLEAPKTWRVELNFVPPTKLPKLVLLKTSQPLEQLGSPGLWGFIQICFLALSRVRSRVWGQGVTPAVRV